MRIEVIEQKHFAGAVADECAALMAEAVEDRGVCTVALSGGSTPGQVYRALSVPPRAQEIPWKDVKLFWGDDRWVSASDTLSNYRMVQETLLNHLSHDKPAVFPVQTTLANPAEGARAYHAVIEKEVAKVDGIPTFDVMILGVGEDGHTASLFPNSPVLKQKESWAYAVDHPSDGTRRVTLSRDVIAAARTIIYIVTGAAKAPIVRELIEGQASVEQYPARLHTEAKNRVIWFIDSAAAAQLSSRRGG